MKKGILFILVIVFFAFTSNAQKNTLQLSGKVNTTPVNKSKDALWTQMDVGANGYASQDFETANDAYDCQIADDFVVTGGVWNIDSVECFGGYSASGPLEYMNIYFYNDDAGAPGTLIQEFLDVPCETASKSGLVQVLLPSTISLSDGTYWISNQARMDYDPAGQWWYYEATSSNGSQFYWINPGGDFGNGTSWQPATNIWTCENDITFALYGSIGSSGAPITFVVDNTANTSFTGFRLIGSWDATGNYDDTWNGGAEQAEFYDDGTHGDATADDDIWSVLVYLQNDGGTNSWEWGVNDDAGNLIDGNFAFTVPDDNPQTLTYATVGMKDISFEGINIYPNPSGGVFTVNVENDFILEVFDITGKVITTRTLTGNITLELNTAGVYFLRFSNEEGSVTQRVIVQ